MKYTNDMQIIGAVMIALCIVIRYVIARRKFNRKASTGNEGFKNFERSWVIPASEKIASIASILLFLLGAVLIVATFV